MWQTAVFALYIKFKANKTMKSTKFTFSRKIHIMEKLFNRPTEISCNRQKNAIYVDLNDITRLNE